MKDDEIDNMRDNILIFIFIIFSSSLSVVGQRCFVSGSVHLFSTSFDQSSSFSNKKKGNNDEMEMEDEDEDINERNLMIVRGDRSLLPSPSSLEPYFMIVNSHSISISPSISPPPQTTNNNNSSQPTNKDDQSSQSQQQPSHSSNLPSHFTTLCSLKHSILTFHPDSRIPSCFLLHLLTFDQLGFVKIIFWICDVCFLLHRLSHLIFFIIFSHLSTSYLSQF